MEDIVQVHEMTETIFSCPISEPSENGAKRAGKQHIMVGDLQLGVG